MDASRDQAVRRWYVARIKPRQDQKVSALLSSRGLMVFCPQVQRRRRPGESEPPLEPLFPSYLFVQLADATDDWLRSRSAPGVAYFLGTADAPTTVPDQVVEEIRTRADAIRRAGPRIPYLRGEHVVIASGPLAGLDAIFDRAISGRGRVRVLLEVIGRLVPADLDVASLYPSKP